MKRLTCEMCGGTDLIKNDGVFICQSCGTKYSVEEAKKMMHDGVVEMSGTLRLDNSVDLEKTLKNARRARDAENYELAEKYYEMVFDADSDNWEGVFFYTYFRAIQHDVDKIGNAVNSVSNCLGTVLNLIKNNLSEEAEQEKAVTEVAIRTTYISEKCYDTAKNHYAVKHNAFDAINTLYNLGNKLDEIFGDKNYANVLSIASWETGLSWHKSQQGTTTETQLVKAKIADKIKEYGIEGGHQESSNAFTLAVALLILFMFFYVLFYF